MLLRVVMFNFKKSIALGVVKGGKYDTKLIIPMEKKNINVIVADPVFLDKENKIKCLIIIKLYLNKHYCKIFR